MRRFFRHRKRRTPFLIGAALVSPAVLFGILFLTLPFPAGRLIEARTGGSAFILDRNDGLIAWRINAEEAWRIPTSIGNISPWLVKATIAAEDRRFRSHAGS